MNSEHITDEQKVVEICERIGFGRVQQIAGDAWEQRHNCAPRGRMGVTVRNEKPAAQPLPEHADHVSEIAARLRLVAKLAGCPQAVPENDHTAVGAIFSVLGNMRLHLERKQPEPVQVFGIKDGTETLLGTAPMPARMKARELAREQFGHFEDDDGSDAELCFGAMEQLIDHMEQSTKQGFTPATK